MPTVYQRMAADPWGPTTHQRGGSSRLFSCIRAYRLVAMIRPYPRPGRDRRDRERIIYHIPCC